LGVLYKEEDNGPKEFTDLSFFTQHKDVLVYIFRIWATTAKRMVRLRLVCKKFRTIVNENCLTHSFIEFNLKNGEIQIPIKLPEKTKLMIVNDLKLLELCHDKQSYHGLINWAIRKNIDMKEMLKRMIAPVEKVSEFVPAIALMNLFKISLSNSWIQDRNVTTLYFKGNVVLTQYPREDEQECCFEIKEKILELVK
jgi:hypothetical protein